ncbi:MAG: ribosome biogenesis GTPase Der [Proteobacteria bacterium]|nr:ribosome biogenesis GTPase Der [Pseudomonadota bacterium]
MLRIAIVGRPNVGKSTLFNRLAGKKLALTHDTPGVTRDWRGAEGRLYDLTFQILDTAGVESAKAGSFNARLNDVTRRALEEADVALLVVDAREGLKSSDRETAALLRKTGLPILLVANKCDNLLPAGYDEFHSLGFGEPIAVSAEHGAGMRDLYDALKEQGSKVRRFEGSKEAFDSEPPHLRTSEPKSLHLAVIGRPNVGKSTLVNALLGKERMLTGPEAGLTRDAVHIPWEWQGKKIRLVDTAGLRKAQKIHEKLEIMSVDESKRAIRLAHVVVLVVDATQMFEKQDLDLARVVVDEGRALVIAVNKWDLVNNKQEVTGALRDFLDKNLAQVPGIPLVALSALKEIEKFDKKANSDSPPFEGGARGGVGRDISQTFGNYSLPQPSDPTPLSSAYAKASADEFAQQTRRSLGEDGPPSRGGEKNAHGGSLNALMKEVFSIYEMWNRRISTSDLNKWLEPLLEHHPPPITNGRRIKIRYMTQIKARPPTFLIWVSKPLKLPETYLRYLSNDMRRFFDMPGVPLRFEMRKGDNPYKGKKDRD